MAEANSTPYGVIYCARNRINGKRYIGQTTRTAKERWGQHCAATGCRVLQNAIRKYGQSSFELSVLEIALSKDELDRLEVFYISLFNTTNRLHGYNLALGGHRGKHSQESKDRISSAKIGHPVSEECRRKISIASMGRKATNETKALLSELHKGKKLSSEHAGKLRAANIGKRATVETKAKQSEIRKRLWADEGSREAMRKSSIAARQSDEYKLIVASNSKAQWADEGARQRLLEARARTQEAGNAARTEAWRDPIKRAARLEKLAATYAAKKAA